jgi:aromatic ring hydroxylase
MPLRTPQQYLDSLKDSRTVYYRGQRVPDVVAHPVTGLAARHASIDYQMAEGPRHRDLAVVADEDGGGEYARYYKLPTSTDDLLKRSALIEQGTTLGRTLVLLIKEIGTDALNGLHLVAHEMDDRLETSYFGRVQDYWRYCRDNDLALAVAQTDVKGDRAKGPSEQPHPDMYLRVVEERADGIVVRGAKTHTSYTPVVNEVIVLPTRAMSEADKDYAVAFAVPVDTKGLSLVTSPFGGHLDERSAFEFPITARHKMVETTTIFEDVFVPWERVFLRGEYQFAGPIALGFVEFHRFTAISYKLPLVDALVGAAQLMADYNGIARAPHVRDKLIQLISYAETLRALTHHAALKGKERALGIVVPDALTVNMAKWHFAHNYHHAVQHVQDITGGLLVTGPGAEDVDSPEIGPLIERYYGGRAGVGGRERLAAINFVKDLTSSDYGGYQEVLAIHAEGSLEAEKLMISRSYDGQRSLNLVKEMIGE